MSESPEDPFMAGLRAAKPTTLFSSPSAGAGKSSGGGLLEREGDLGGITDAVPSKDSVGIVRLNAKDLITKYCGGLIGRAGNRACLIENCDVQSHRAKRFEFQDDTDQLFICVKDLRAFYIKPSISPSALEPHLERYLAESRSVASWETLFRGIENQPEQEREVVEVERLVKRIDQDKKDYGMTPMKKKPRFKSSSDDLEAGFAIAISEMDEELDTDFNRDFPDKWKTVVKNIRQLVQVTQAVRDHGLEMAQTTEEELDGLAYTIAKLANLVGERPPQVGPMTIFDCIRAASVEMDGLIQQFSPERMAMLEDHIRQNFPQTQNEFRNNLFGQMSKSLDPVFKLFNSLSSGPTTPGDKLSAEFNRIQSELGDLQREVSSHKNMGFAPNMGNSFGSLAGGFQGTSLGGGGPTTQRASGLDVESRLQALEDQVQAVQVQLESNRVEIGGHTFRSRDEVKAWLTVQAKTPGSYVYFVDAHSLLGLATVHANSNTEVIQLQMAANKTGYTSADEALVLSGFSLELPTFFGKDGQVNEATQDMRVLPGVKDFDSWDPPGGHSGARKRLERQVGGQQKHMSTSAQQYLTPSGTLVAREMINQSAFFLMALGTWMSQHYVELTGKGGNPDNAWKLISHSVRAIFSDLHVARMAGRGPFPKSVDQIEKASGVMWGSLQAQAKMAEFVEAGFTSHPRLSHILNIHLQEHAVLRHELEDVLARLTEAEKAAEKAQSTADSAKTLAKKK